MIPVIGFATHSRFDLANRLLMSIDYPVQHLVIVNNSGNQGWQPFHPPSVKNIWHLELPHGIGLVGAWNLIVKATPYAPYWVLVNDDAYFEPGALATIAEQADPNALSFPDITPPWSCIVLGEEIVRQVGLYDERLYPLYFDDNDYERRIRHRGMPIKNIPAKVHHDNSASLKGFEAANNYSYHANQRLYGHKVATDDYSEGNWSLEIRRANRWD